VPTQAATHTRKAEINTETRPRRGGREGGREGGESEEALVRQDEERRGKSKGKQTHET